jgi:hypothetical protein
MARRPPLLSIPEASRITTWIRRQFAVRLAGVVGHPSWASTRRPVAYWLDRNHRLNRALVLAYQSPCPEDPRAPLILRISINYHAGEDAERVVRRMLGVKPREETPFFSPPDWSFELSALPEQVIDFVPWVMFLAWAHETGSVRFLKTPHPCYVWGGDDDLLQRNYAWTQAAWKKTDAHRRSRERRKGTGS